MTVTTKINPVEGQIKHVEKIIQKGLDREYRTSILSLERIIVQWKANKLSDSDAYFKLVHKLILSDKNIARRYDHLLPEDYASVVASQLSDGFISQDDLVELDDTLKREILSFIQKGTVMTKPPSE